MRPPTGKMRVPRYCRHTSFSTELRAHDRTTHEKEGSGSSSEMTSCQVDPGTSWMKSFEWKLFELKHIMMEASSDLSKSLVMLNWKIVWQDMEWLASRTRDIVRELSKH